MIIRINPNALAVLAGSFITRALAIGIPSFSLDYSDVNRPNVAGGLGVRPAGY